MPTYTPYPAPTPWINQPSAPSYADSNAIKASGSPQGFVVNPYSGPQFASPADVSIAGVSKPYVPQIQAPQPSAATTSQTQSSGGNITEQEAVAKGLDWNNLPSGYSRNIPAQQGPSQADLLAQQTRNEINTGFDNYFSELDRMLGNIPSQQAGQNQMVENNYNQGISDINAQKASSMGDLATQRRKTGESQVKSLADIADNIRSLFQTGNVMLGTRGAGDSSAADRYSYAVTKLGSKQRGDVMAQTRSIEADIGDREAKLNNIVTQETAKLKTNRDNQILQVAQYFQDQMNALLQAKAQGQLQKGQSLASLSTQLLQQAQQQLMTADSDFRNRQNSLLSWAESNSKTIGELKNNLAALGQYNAPGIQTQSINGTPTFDAQGNMSAPLYFGSYGTRTERDANGNIIKR